MLSTFSPFRRTRADGPVRQKFASTIRPTGVERTFGKDEVIVSKTDPKGIITYANEVFLDLAALTERQAIGAPHSIIRHPAMPRAVFKLLWDTVARGDEIFAYVLNMAATGDHYWVFAHVTPTFAMDGGIIGYHSNRRVPDREAIAAIEPLYADLKAIEDRAPDRARGLSESFDHLVGLLSAKGVSYDEFVFSLTR
ncbi:MAG: PAS domain-containing protein [Hyphomicrobiales bacterium]|nr:PAS domain-containing protein [Hyphomicrobiales bacterium]